VPSPGTITTFHLPGGPGGRVMVRLFDSDTETPIGEITEAQLDFLQEELIEETIDVYTYNLSPAALDSLEMSGGDETLIVMLRKAMGTRSSMEVRYELD
jgi:hypothetical protein